MKVVSEEARLDAVAAKILAKAEWDKENNKDAYEEHGWHMGDGVTMSAALLADMRDSPAMARSMAKVLEQSKADKDARRERKQLKARLAADGDAIIKIINDVRAKRQRPE